MGNAVWMTVWLSCGILGFVGGLMWLGSAQRARRVATAAVPRVTAAASATILQHRAVGRPAADVARPDTLAG